MLSTVPIRKAVAAVAALAALVLLPSTANAGILVADASGCDPQVFSQPFLPWADVAQYTLQPGGSFEKRTDDWALDGATIVPGNEPFNVTADSDRNALHISNGGSATSGAICVGIEHPDIRFFARSANPSARLTVEVLFEDAAGNVQSAPIGAVLGSGDWAVTPTFPIVANLLPLLPGNHTAVAFRFRADGASFRIDDVYVDPMQRW